MTTRRAVDEGLTEPALAPADNARLLDAAEYAR
jgi:hypothetical protein